MSKALCILFTGIFLPIMIWSCQPPPETPGSVSKTGNTAAETKKQTWEVEWQDTLAAAKKEGELTVFAVPGSETRVDLANAFRSKFGINLDFVTGRGEELATKVFTERRAGLFSADVILGGQTLPLVFAPAGVLDPLDSLLFLPEVRDPKAWQGGRMFYYDEEKTSLAMIASALRFGLRNKDMVKDNEITSYTDLLDPKWKGKITMRDATIAGTGNALLTHLAVDIWDMERTKQWMREMVKQEPAITRDSRMQVEWVARGKYPVGVATRIEDTAFFIKEGAPVATIKMKEGVNVGAGSGCLAIFNKRPHPNAAKLFVNWLLTKEGQTVFVRGFGNPSARLDVPTEGIPLLFFVEPGEKVFFESMETLNLRPKMMEVANEIFSPVSK